MKEMYLESKSTIETGDNRLINVEYYLVKESSTEKVGDFMYGIYLKSSDSNKETIEETGGISYSMEVVKQIIASLHKNQVTPITALEIIEDMITLKLCS